jgi:hypothetical protein
MTTKVVIFNDTSRFHHGSAAVMQTLFRTVERLGWTLSASFFGNSFIFEKAQPVYSEALVEDADIILINGEGTIHDDSPMAVFLFSIIEKYRHKKICLLNTLWQNIGPELTQKLAHVDLVVARDHASFDALSRVYQGPLYLTPDFSSRAVPPLATMVPQGILFGGFYWQQHGRAAGVAPNTIALKGMEGDGEIDITRENWHTVVNRLRHASLLVTGKHHDVMAAIVARCPFLFCPVKTHKIEALGRFAGIALLPVDMTLTESQYRDRFQQAIGMTGHYGQLFDAIDTANSAFDLEATLKAIA